MKYRVTRHFRKCFEQLPTDIRDQAKKSFKLFKEQPFHPYHPSLRIKPMKGHSDIWEGHITLGYVFTFHREEDDETGEITFVFRKIGHHDIYRNP